MKFVELKKHIASGELKGAYAFAGDDPFLIQSAVGMLAALIDFPDLNIAVYNDDSPVAQMCEDYSQLPMMSKYKLMKIEVDKRTPNELTRFLAYVKKNPCPDTIIAFTSFNLPSALASNLGYFEYVDCYRLDKPMVIKWIAAQSGKDKFTITEDAASLLSDYCLNNLTRISVELKKLADAKNGETIGESDVKEYVAADGDFKIYELSDALARKDADRTYTIYDSLIVNTPPVAIIGALYSHFRRLLYAAIGGADNDTLARYMRVKPYAMSVAARQAKLYTPVRLKRIVDRLSGIDADFKSGLIGDRLALDAFIAETLCIG